MAALMVRGRTTGTSRSVTTEGGIVVEGWKPVLLVVARTGTKEQRRKFERFCKFNGIAYSVPHEVARKGKLAWETTYEVTGSGLALELLTTKEFILSWSYVMDTKAPRFRSSTYRQGLTQHFVEHLRPMLKPNTAMKKG